MTFDDWWEKNFEDIMDGGRTQADWFKEAYETGYNYCADLNDCHTYEEIMEHVQND